MAKNVLKDVFNPKCFSRTFIRQRDSFSCVAACCATIARLYGLPVSQDLEFFRSRLHTTPDGVSMAKLEKLCRTVLPVTSMGCNSYHGGVALGFIRHKPDGVDHAVVFLARNKDVLIYYDPYDHRVLRDTVGNMQRGSDRYDSYKTWTANFLPLAGADFEFWEAQAEDNPYKLREQAFWRHEHG